MRGAVGSFEEEDSIKLVLIDEEPLPSSDDAGGVNVDECITKPATRTMRGHRTGSTSGAQRELQLLSLLPVFDS